jgi:hypothetical protein
MTSGLPLAAHVGGLVLVLALILGLPVHAGQEATGTAPVLSTAEMETFLLKGKIVRKRGAGLGTTGSLRVTLSDGALTHDAHVQVVDVQKTTFEAGRASEVGFKDSYRFNIAAYRLATLLGINVPMSVQRNFEGQPGSFTWWVDDVAMDENGRVKSGSRGPDPERTSKQMYVMRAFDELIENRDRNRGNILWTKDGTLWLIDHSRAFRLGHELRKIDDLTRIDRAFLARLRALDGDRIRKLTDGVAFKGEIDAVMKRRDALVAHFDKRIAERGEAAVLFTLDK